MVPIGIVTIGHPAPDRRSSSLKRGWRPDDQVIHWQTWSTGDRADESVTKPIQGRLVVGWALDRITKARQSRTSVATAALWSIPCPRPDEAVSVGRGSWPPGAVDRFSPPGPGSGDPGTAGGFQCRPGCGVGLGRVPGIFSTRSTAGTSGRRDLLWRQRPNPRAAGRVASAQPSGATPRRPSSFSRSELATASSDRGAAGRGDRGT